MFNSAHSLRQEMHHNNKPFKQEPECHGSSSFSEISTNTYPEPLHTDTKRNVISVTKSDLLNLYICTYTEICIFNQISLRRILARS